MPIARRALPMLAAVAAAALPAAAQGAEVQLDRTCYAPGDAVTALGSGFSPGAQVQEELTLVSPAAASSASFSGPPLTTSAQGAFSRQLRAPALVDFRDRREQALSVFTDQTDTSITVSKQWTLSAWDVRIKEWAGGVGRPGRSMTLDTLGWTTASGSLFGHYYRGTTRVKTVRFGITTGACGDLLRRVPQFPFKRVKAGQYSLYVSPAPILDKVRDAWIRLKIRVPRSAATA